MVTESRSRTAVPPLPEEFVPRPALLAALDDGDGTLLTLLSAPPGYGKTLLLADWVRGADVPCAWVGLDEDDDDPRRLWTSVLAALCACPAVPADSPLHRLVVPRTSVDAGLLTRLLAALADLPVPVRLVLDDAHHLRSPEALRGLRMLLKDRLRTVRLVLAGRLDPALPLAKLRLEGRLCELRTAQLAFTREETAALVARCGLDLTPEQTAVLHDRSDGWPAGIRLATLPLRDHPSPDAFLAAFSGDERPVADYLAGEVFAHLSDEDGELLRRTSISDPIPTALAVELTGRADAAGALDALERSTGLLVAAGPHRTEFRFQELVRSYLTAELYRHGPETVAALHRQAAVWWAEQGRPVEALRHAAQAGDRDLLVALLHRWAPELVARGEHTVLQRALDRIAAAQAGTDPWLPLVAAQIHIGTGDRSAARADLARATGQSAADGDPDLGLFRTATTRLAGLGGPVGERDPLPEDPALAALALAGRGAAAAFSGAGRQGRDPVTVPADLETALALAREQHLDLLEVQCLCLIGTAALIAGEQARATSASDAAIAAAGANGWSDSPWTAGAHAVLAQASLLRAVPGQALQAATDGLAVPASQHDPVVRFALRGARGGALFDLGDRQAGLLELQEAQAELGAVRAPTPVAASMTLLEHRAALLLGYRVAAATSHDRLTGRAGAEGERLLMRAWSAAAAGEAREARRIVAPLIRGESRPILSSTLVDVWLLEAWAALRLGDRPTARRALHTALDLAEPMDLLRPFAFAGQGLRVLLVDALGGAGDPGSFAFRCLAARRQTNRPAAPELSAREQDVLTQLVSLSNLGEIADELDVSVNTVKSHVRAIYGKLGVNTRRTAVLTALERGLLT
jgi:LuxR family maltose regulon positive regulatory protein